MFLFCDVPTQLLIQQLGVRVPAGPISIPRGPQIPTIFQFSQNGVVYDPETFLTNLTSISIANPGAVTTQQPHNIPNGSTVALAGVTGSVPAISGNYVATVTSPTSFTIPVNVTTAATINVGTVTVVVPLLPRWTVKAQDQYNQDPPAAIIPAGSFVKSGSGTSTTFTGQCNYITPYINQALGIVAPITLTATISEAAPGVVTTSAQSFGVGDIITFETTEVLPAPLQPGIEYYITATNLTATTFTVAATLGGTAITTTTAGSGVHTIIREVEVNSVASVPLLGELSWNGAFPSKAQIINVTLLNDLFKPSDGPPVYTGGVSGTTVIGNGNGYVNIVFPYTLASASWHFLYLYVSNTVDPTPLNIWPGIATAQSTTGATVQLNGLTDSASYLLNYAVALN